MPAVLRPLLNRRAFLLLTLSLSNRTSFTKITQELHRMIVMPLDWMQQGVFHSFPLEMDHEQISSSLCLTSGCSLESGLCWEGPCVLLIVRRTNGSDKIEKKKTKNNQPTKPKIFRRNFLQQRKVIFHFLWWAVDMLTENPYHSVWQIISVRTVLLWWGGRSRVKRTGNSGKNWAKRNWTRY